jgi:DNA repair protein RadC
VIEKVKISQGGISETSADLRIILKAAINALAAGIILCHNHPSGNPRQE